MLQPASGNQLLAQMTLTDGADMAVGQIARLGYR
jgi:hypothetical protein